MTIIENTRTLSKVDQKSKSKKRLIRIVCWVVLALSAVLIVQVVKEISYTLRLQSALQTTKAQFSEVEATNAELTQQKSKLEDPGYVKAYARGSLLLSGKDQQIFTIQGSGN